MAMFGIELYTTSTIAGNWHKKKYHILNVHNPLDWELKYIWLVVIQDSIFTFLLQLPVSVGKD